MRACARTHLLLPTLSERDLLMNFRSVAPQPGRILRAVSSQVLPSVGAYAMSASSDARKAAVRCPASGGWEKMPLQLVSEKVGQLAPAAATASLSAAQDQSVPWPAAPCAQRNTGKVKGRQGGGACGRRPDGGGSRVQPGRDAATSGLSTHFPLLQSGASAGRDAHVHEHQFWKLAPESPRAG